MKTYLIQLCNEDGSTPLGQCPTYEIEGEDYLDAQFKAMKAHPGTEVVSWGLKSDIEAYNKRWNL
jgi:hypothetical protein